MNGRQTALMPGNEDKVGYWLTPWDKPPFPAICAEFGFDPPEWKKAFDATPYPRPAGFNGLKEPWPRRPVWVNPPFTDSFAAWSKKCIAEYGEGKPVIMIASVDRWVSRLLAAGAEVRDMGRIEWVDPSGKTRMSRFSHALFILRPKP